MSHPFRVGDLVILQRPTYYLEDAGCPAVIVGDYAERWAVDMRTMKQRMAWTYEVRRLKEPDCLGGDTQVVLVYPHQIRKPDAGEQQRFRQTARDTEVSSC